MRFYYLIIPFILVNTFVLKSQVGINTQSAQGVFHVDPKGDTSAATNGSDDFIITSAGRVGIGTVSPTASLDVVGNLRIADGSEYDRYVMTSDAAGLGSWKRQTYTSRIVGNVSATLANLRSGDIITPSDWSYTGANITLPAGNWMIYYYCIYNNNNSVNFTIWWDLCTSTTWVLGASVGRVLSYFAPTTGLSPTYASYGVSPGVTTTYYVLGFAGGSTVPAGLSFTYNSGARIWAIPVF